MRCCAFRLVMAIGVALATLGAAPTPAHADTVAEQFVARINDLRTARGLGPVQEDGALMQFAQSWSDHLAAAGTLSHHPTMADSPGDWTKVGENVGFGPDVDTVFAAFIASREHYTNLVEPSFNTVGIGVTVLPDGTIYTTQEFEARPLTAPVAPVGRASRSAARSLLAAPMPVRTSPIAPRPAVRPVATPGAPRRHAAVSPTTVPVAAPVAVPVFLPAPGLIAAAPAPPAAPLDRRPATVAIAGLLLLVVSAQVTATVLRRS